MTHKTLTIQTDQTMADGGCSSKNPSRSRVRIKPQHDAEKHIRLKTDKTGLTKVYVNSYKGQSLSAMYSFQTCVSFT